MISEVKSKAEKFKIGHIRKKRRYAVLTAMASIVVFVTVYALILPALSWERSLICEKEAHTHGESCYEAVTVPAHKELLCTQEEHVHTDDCWEEVRELVCTDSGVHTHSDACYTVSEEPLCGLSGEDGHTHSAECYRTLICGYEEGAEHIHTDACYAVVERALKCDVPEHTHTDECYTDVEEITERRLICGVEEHEHSDSCFDAPPAEESVWFCGRAEHTHNENCFLPDGTLICTMEEHRHSPACNSDRSADIEDEQVWTAAFAGLKFSGNWAQDTLAIAQTQLDYAESTRNFIVNEDGTVNGYTRYGAWYGLRHGIPDTYEYGDWCAMFVSFCIDYAGVKDFPQDANCAQWVKTLSYDELEPDKPVYYTPAAMAEPAPGDLIFYDFDTYAPGLTEGVDYIREADHVGLVCSVTPATETEGARIVTVEGNVCDRVCCLEHDLNDSGILGYARLPENPDYVERDPYEPEERSIVSDPAEDGAIAEISGVLPVGAVVSIEAVELSGEEMIAYFGAERAAIMKSYVAYDIRIMVGEEEWQPDESVSVLVRRPAITLDEGDKLAVAHLGDTAEPVSDINMLDENGAPVEPSAEPARTEEDGAEPTLAETEEPARTTVPEELNVRFPANGFSVYLFYTYTVDFHFGDYSMSIPGGSTMLLSELLQSMGIERDVKDVFSVSFSNPALLKVEKTGEGDWRLTSLQPFSSDEKLTIEFTDGEVYVIDVTDAQTGSTTYWQEVFTIDDVDDSGNIRSDINYMIVSETDGFALGLNKSGTTTSVFAKAANLIRLDQSYDYYETAIGDDYWWNFSGTIGSAKIKNKASSSYGLKLNNNSNVIATDNITSNALTYNITDSNWKISRKVSGSTYYLKYNKGSYSVATGDTNDRLRIFKKLDANPLAGQGVAEGNDGLIIKPRYPDIVTPSGSTAQNGIAYGANMTLNVRSDASTSALESILRQHILDDDPDNGSVNNNGRILTDKSVVYNANDYYTGWTYEKDEFSVTLSALGQKYPIVNQIKIESPLDVVFVVDCSGSMISTTYGTARRTSASILVEALNNAMSTVQASNPNNRVSVACFSGSSAELLPLGRYKTTNSSTITIKDAQGKPVQATKYYFFDEGDYKNDEAAFSPSSAIRTESGGNVSYGTYSGGWYGTYTQRGLEQGADVLLRESEVTLAGITQMSDGTDISYSVQRQPVIILVSDGEPTYCTDEFTNVIGSAKMYGSGGASYGKNNNGKRNYQDNNRGVLGYYTILTAQYLKNEIAKHYHTDASFFSIGVGINESGENSLAPASSAGDDYKRTVLDPTTDNVKHLQNCTAGKNGNGESTDVDNTCHQLYKLLHNSYTESFITVLEGENYGIPVSKTGTSVPVNTHTFTSYNYADEAYFISSNSVETLTSTFGQAISKASKKITVYGYALSGDKNVIVSDPIGSGMELKNAASEGPVLYYGFTSRDNADYNPAHLPTGKSSSGNTTTYTYTGTFTDPFSGFSADLSRITVKLITDENGDQTVTLEIPRDLMPYYTPLLKAKEKDSDPDEIRFFYEQFPVRLIYKVGLTQDSKDKVDELRSAASSTPLSFNTNRYVTGETPAEAQSAFQPYTNNPTYFVTGSVPTVRSSSEVSANKASNVSGTDPNSISYKARSDMADKVTALLGNNGRLTFSPLAEISVEKIWSDSETVDHANDKITLTLNGTAEGGTAEKLGEIVLPRDGKWEYTFENIPMTDAEGREYSYSVVETGSPKGYMPTVSGDETGRSFTVTNQKSILLEVTKLFKGGLTPAEITVEVYKGSNIVSAAVDNEPVATVRLNAENGYASAIQLPALADGEFYAVRELVPDGCNAVYRNSTANRSFLLNGESVPGSLMPKDDFKPDAESGMEKAATTITNFPDSRLPSTGGLGMAELLPVLGALILCATFSYALVVRKKKKTDTQSAY